MKSLMIGFVWKVLTVLAIMTPAAAWSTQISNSLEAVGSSALIVPVAEEIATEWSDGNISTGTSMLTLGKLKSAMPTATANWKKLGENLFSDFVKHLTNEQLPAGTQLLIATNVFRPTDVSKTARAVAEGNAFNMDNDGLLSGLRGQTWKLVRSLGSASDIQVFRIKTKLLDDSSQEMRVVRLHGYVNKKSAEAFFVFTVEGTM